VTDGLLKMSELAEASGVSSGTIKHYLREGLLGDGDEIVRTSRNMAYYPPDYVERIRLIKRLQEERFLPLRHIRDVLAVGDSDRDRVPRREAAERHGVPDKVLARLEELGVLGADGYDADDERIVAAIARFRAGGYDESLGFTVYDTLRYRDALAPLVGEEVRVLLDRLAGEVSVERAVEIIGSGAEPLRELIGAMHSRMLREELRRRREEA
jgi:DNA-binding transcriptional MerR regulator